MLRFLKKIWPKAARRIAAQDASHLREQDSEESASDSESLPAPREWQRIQGEIDHVRRRDAERLAALNDRIATMEATSEADRREIAALRQSLEEASGRQEQTEALIRQLRERQETERRAHQDYIRESQARERRHNRRLGWSLMLACCALLLGTFTGVTAIRDGRQHAGVLAELSRDIKDIKVSMEQQLGSLHDSLDEYRLSLPDALTSRQFPDSGPTATGNPVEPSEGMLLESPPASASYGFHPHNRHRTRSDMRTFFEENARQLGVISLDSGLQYKVLSRGNGRRPGPADRVVFDYQTFLADGTEIYNSYHEKEPAVFGIDEVVPGLREALQRMDEGAQWELYVPPRLAHKGVRKRGRGKQAFEPFIYVVELKSVM